MKISAIIQARMSSARLPGKVCMELSGKPVLVNIVERAKMTKLIDHVVVATSTHPTDDPLVELMTDFNIPIFRGSLSNVLERYYFCARESSSDIIIRLTGDNALVDPRLMDEAIQLFLGEQVDYLSFKRSLPLGMCVEVFSFFALEQSYFGATDRECLEHVTPYIRTNVKKFKVLYHDDPADIDHSDLRFTIDTPEDYDFVKKIYSSFTSNCFTYDQILALL